MIRNPDFPSPAEILQAMRDHAPHRVTGPPETPEERAEAHEALLRITADANNVKVICIGCGESAPLFDAVACMCGGFVCPACQRIEGEGECHHTPMVLPSGVDDDGDD